MAHKYKDPYSGKIKSNRYFRKQKGKKRLRYIYNIGGDNWFPWPVVWSDYDFDTNIYKNIPAPGAYLRRNWRPKISKQIKKYCHRKNRRVKCSDELTNYTYDRNAEFWWELW